MHTPNVTTRPERVLDVLATAQLPGEVMVTVALPPLVKTLLPADTVIVPPLPKA